MIDKIQEALRNRDIAFIYEAYRSEDISSKDQAELGEIIVEMAQEDLHEKIVTQMRFDYKQKREQYVLRVLYELALSTYEAGEMFEAREQFALLSCASNEAHFSNAMKRHVSALLMDVEHTVFMQEWVDMTKITRFYIASFTKQSDKISKKNSKQVDALIAPIAKLFVVKG